MTDTVAVDLATHGRPRAGEVMAILAACAFVLVVLVHFDGAAARDEASRARTALAERAAAARKPKPATPTRRRGDQSLGGAGPITVPVGSAWSAGTSPAAGHNRAAGAFDPPGIVLVVLAGLGALMALTGSTLIARTRR